MVLHRIWVGDEMARECRGLMGIGRDAMRKDIMAYFPDTSGVRGRILASVDEGVPLNQDSGKNPPPVVLGKRSCRFHPADHTLCRASLPDQELSRHGLRLDERTVAQP
jgi:hypothetical protein